MAAKTKPKNEPAETPPEEPKEPVSTDIDDRMEALLDDHIRMGARPPRAK